MGSYPNSVWDGDSKNRDSDKAPYKEPNADDWNRMITEVAATQTRVDSNNAGVDDDTLDSVGVVTTKTGLSVVEKGNGAVHKTILTFDEVSIATVDGSSPATDGAWFTQNLYTFPVGQVVIWGAHAQFPLGDLEATDGGGAGLSDTADFEIGVGTVASANASSFGLGNGTQENIVEALDCDLTSGTSDAIETNVHVTAAIHNGTAGAIVSRLNMRTLDDADHGTVADALIVSGTVTLLWTALGDD